MDKQRTLIKIWIMPVVERRFLWCELYSWRRPMLLC